MILEAKYVGPLPRVTVPGYDHRTVAKDEVVKVRVSDGQSLGGCWEIVKGKTKYNAALKKVAEEKRAAILALRKGRKAQRATAESVLDKAVEAEDEARYRHEEAELAARDEKSSDKKGKE